MNKYPSKTFLGSMMIFLMNAIYAWKNLMIKSLSFYYPAGVFPYIIDIVSLNGSIKIRHVRPVGKNYFHNSHTRPSRYSYKCL